MTAKLLQFSKEKTLEITPLYYDISLICCLSANLVFAQIILLRMHVLLRVTDSWRKAIDEGMYTGAYLP